MNDAKTITLAKKVIELMEGERNALRSAHLDVDYMLTTLMNLFEQATAAEQQQEAMKRQTKLMTESWLGLKKKMHVTASGFLDMCIGAVSKDSDAARNFRRIRSELYRSRSTEKPIVQPVKA